MNESLLSNIQKRRLAFVITNRTFEDSTGISNNS